LKESHFGPAYEDSYVVDFPAIYRDFTAEIHDLYALCREHGNDNEKLWQLMDHMQITEEQRCDMHRTLVYVRNNLHTIYFGVQYECMLIEEDADAHEVDCGNMVNPRVRRQSQSSEIFEFVAEGKNTYIYWCFAR
jgi:hypothetical protein